MVFAVVLGLLLQSVPSNAHASYSTKPASIGVVVGLGLLALGIFDGVASSAKATGTEFEKLNNNPAFPTLLKQMAGGSLSTVEILN